MLLTMLLGDDRMPLKRRHPHHPWKL